MMPMTMHDGVDNNDGASCCEALVADTDSAADDDDGGDDDDDGDDAADDGDNVGDGHICMMMTRRLHKLMVMLDVMR